MKKLIYCALALAAGLFAGSCQQDNLEPVAGGNTVTYTVELPGVDTKTIGDGVNINQLVYEVWRTENPNDVTLEPGAKTELLYRVADKQMVSGSTIIELDLVNDQNYTILFWAQVRDGGYYNTGDLRNVTLTNKSSNAFEEDRAAFYGVDFIKATDPRKVKQTVTLTRPFGQVNLGTAFRTEAQQAVYTLNVDNTSVTVKGASTVFNVATGAASAETEDCTDLEFSAYTYVTNSENLIVKNETTEIPYQWISMNYVFVPANQATLEVDYTIETNHGVVTNTISNIPAKKNYRTNIVGNLLTSKTEYTVNLDTRWDGADFNTTVIEEGIVKNANGDYEVSTPHGLAYMLNNLFKENHVLAEGGNFYLTAAEYDMTDMIVESPAVPATKTLNIYGETPVVTRSTRGLAGITIKGLTKPLIGNVKGAVSVSGVTLDDEGSVLVEKNEGTVVVSEVEADVIVPEGDGNIPPVSADNVGNHDALKTALASGVKVIDITANFDANEAIVIDRSITINGKGNTLTSSYNRVINFTAPEINVEINDWSFISTAARNGENGPRGLNIWGPEVHDAILTFNNCSVDFTDPSANDWTYAINCGVNENNTITINGGTYEGANVINIHGAKSTITVKNATLNCTYPANDTCYGACIWVKQEQGSSVYAEGNTFNGNNAIAFNLGTGTALEEKDNIDNTMYYSNGIYYVTSVEKLQAAINNAKAGENTIAFSNDITGNVTVVQKPGVKITIDGCDKKYNGFIKVHSNSNHYADAALTIKNVNFETSTPALNFIEALENGSERYSTNITAENCSFTATDAAVNTTVGLQIKASKWAKALNCTATGVHSLIQAQSCDETVVVNGCTITGKNGVAFKQVKSARVEGTTITAAEYGIRFDGNTDNYGIVLKNNNVNAYQPLIVRKMTGANNTITLEGENTLTTDEIYQIVITNGSDDAAYVTPSGTYTLTGADDFVVYPRENYGSKLSDGLYKEGVNYYVANAAGLVALSTTTIKANETVSLIADIDLKDIEFNGLSAFNPENNNTFDGMGHTVSNWTNHSNAADFGFIKSWVGTIKNLTIDNASLKTSGRSAILAGNTYCNIDNCHVVNSTIEDSYWSCGLIAGHYNSGSVSNCSATNSTVKSNGGTGAIVGVVNESTGTRSFTNCVVTGCTVNNTGAYGEGYCGAMVCGMINISNSTVKFSDCELDGNTKEGQFVGDLYYAADDDITIVIE